MGIYGGPLRVLSYYVSDKILAKQYIFEIPIHKAAPKFC